MSLLSNGINQLRALGKWSAFAILNVYAAALIIAAWPNGNDFGELRPIHQASLNLFDQLKIRSGTAVFAGNRGAWKRKSLCVAVVGTNQQDEAITLYQNYPDCVVPNIRFFEDTFNVLLMRAGYSTEMKRFLGASKKGTQKELRLLQNSSSLDRASQYFCYSQQASNEELKSVDMLWEVKQVHYGTGKVRTDRLHAHSFDCKSKRRASRSYRNFEVTMTRTGALTLSPRQNGSTLNSLTGAP